MALHLRTICSRPNPNRRTPNPTPAPGMSLRSPSCMGTGAVAKCPRTSCFMAQAMYPSCPEVVSPCHAPPFMAQAMYLSCPSPHTSWDVPHCMCPEAPCTIIVTSSLAWCNRLRRRARRHAFQDFGPWVPQGHSHLRPHGAAHHPIAISSASSRCSPSSHRHIICVLTVQP